MGTPEQSEDSNSMDQPAVPVSLLGHTFKMNGGSPSNEKRTVAFPDQVPTSCPFASITTGRWPSAAASSCASCCKRTSSVSTDSRTPRISGSRAVEVSSTPTRAASACTAVSSVARRASKIWSVGEAPTRKMERIRTLEQTRVHRRDNAIHAAEYLIAGHIEREYPHLHVWVPTRDVGLEAETTVKLGPGSDDPLLSTPSFITALSDRALRPGGDPAADGPLRRGHHPPRCAQRAPRNPGSRRA